MPTYGEILSKDSDGKKFMSALTNNGGANEFTAIKGANRATQNSEAVADLVVTLDGETVPVTDNGGSLTVDDGSGSLTTDQLSEYTDGATFTRSSSKLLAGLAGIYESTVSALTAGKVALARLTSRGAVVTAGDRFNVTVYDAMPGDASAHHITLGAVGASGSKAARIFVANTTDVAVAVTILLYSTWSASAVYSESIAAGAYRMIGPGAASAAGGSASYKQCDALGYLSHGAGVIYQAATPPTTGTLKIVAMVEV